MRAFLIPILITTGCSSTETDTKEQSHTNPTVSSTASVSSTSTNTSSSTNSNSTTTLSITTLTSTQTSTSCCKIELPKPSDDNEIRIATWNLEWFPLTQETPSIVASIINQEQFDLVGIQEISDIDTFKSLLEQLPDYGEYYAYDDGSDQRVGFLYRKDRISVSDVDMLFEDDWYAFPRPPLKAHIVANIGTSTFDFDFMVLHLKAMSDQESEDRRRDAVVKLEAWMSETLSTQSEQDMVIVGDWNDELTDDAENNIFEPLLQKPEDYSFLTMPLAENDEGSYISYNSLIDHILITSDAISEYGDGTTEVLYLDEQYSDYKDTVSDHRPVMARFHFGESSEN